MTVGGVAACGCVWLSECLHMGRCEPVGGCVSAVCVCLTQCGRWVCVFVTMRMGVCVSVCDRQ